MFTKKTHILTTFLVLMTFLYAMVFSLWYWTGSNLVPSIFVASLFVLSIKLRRARTHRRNNQEQHEHNQQ